MDAKKQAEKMRADSLAEQNKLDEDIQEILDSAREDGYTRVIDRYYDWSLTRVEYFRECVASVEQKRNFNLDVAEQYWLAMGAMQATIDDYIADIREGNDDDDED